jgi:hypothetical protein
LCAKGKVDAKCSIYKHAAEFSIILLNEENH